MFFFFSYIFVFVMRKLFTILLFLVGAVALDRADVSAAQVDVKSEIVDVHHEQFLCNHRHNIDAERTSSVVVPSVRVSSSSPARYSHNRVSLAFYSGGCAYSSNYSASRFVLRLGSFARVVDYYLYMLCVLRL